MSMVTHNVSGQFDPNPSLPVFLAVGFILFLKSLEGLLNIYLNLSKYSTDCSVCLFIFLEHSKYDILPEFRF